MNEWNGRMDISEEYKYKVNTPVFRPGGRTHDPTRVHTHRYKMSRPITVHRVYFSQEVRQIIRSSSQSPGSGSGSEVAHTAAHYLSVPDSVTRETRGGGYEGRAARG